MSPPLTLGPLLDQKLISYNSSDGEDKKVDGDDEDTEEEKDLQLLDEKDVASLLDSLHAQDPQKSFSPLPTFEENPTWLLEIREKRVDPFMQKTQGAKWDPARRIEAVEWIHDCCAEEKIYWNVFVRACAYYEFISLAASQCTCARHMQDHKSCVLGVDAKPCTIMFACICIAHSNESDADSANLYPKSHLARRGSDSFDVFSVTINAIIVWLFKHDLLLVPTLCDWLVALYPEEDLERFSDPLQTFLEREYRTCAYRPYSFHIREIAKEIGLK